MLPFLSFNMDLDVLLSRRFHRVSCIACHAKMKVRSSNICTTQCKTNTLPILMHHADAHFDYSSLFSNAQVEKVGNPETEAP
jgi:hypothetical protein